VSFSGGILAGKRGAIIGLCFQSSHSQLEPQRTRLGLVVGFSLWMEIITANYNVMEGEWRLLPLIGHEMNEHTE
jgi:ABC-type histidine transport system ATPase subunit